jgi:alpha-amylase
MVGSHNRVQGSDMQVLSHGACPLLFRRGSLGIVGINTSAGTVQADVGVHGGVLGWHAGYRDALGSRNVVRIVDANHGFSLPPHAACMQLR